MADFLVSTLANAAGKQVQSVQIMGYEPRHEHDEDNMDRVIITFTDGTVLTVGHWTTEMGGVSVSFV
jgi:hypothetical protein